MLGIPRPRTRGECLEEARPCPWVCRYSLLIEERPHGALELNAPRRGVGRPPYLVSSCDDGRLGMWIDDAVSTLVAKPYSCALDLADEEHTHAEVGEALHIGKEQAELDANRALRKLYVRTMRSMGEDIDERHLPPIKQLAAWLRAVLRM